jgi:lysine-N-methylase
MSMPVRSLPVLQNWDCRACSNCCREYQVSVSPEERQRIEAQGWDKDPEIGDFPLFKRQGKWWSGAYQLNHRSDGSCIFLSTEGRCRIHERHGPAAKPLACRMYPFILVPTGDHWRVGLRYACPSAAANVGRPCADHQGELAEYAQALQKQISGDLRQIPVPSLQGRQKVDWPDLLRFVQAILNLLKNRDDPFEYRMRKCLALAKICRQARFDQVKGSRLAEFLNLVGNALESEAARDPSQVPPPTWVGRVLFRQALALYIRKVHGPDQSQVRSRLALIKAAWRFAQGKGPVPAVHGWLPETTFEKGENQRRPLSAEAERVLERYYLVKFGSLQFCGPTHFGYPFWDGVQALALTLPVLLWLYRVLENFPGEEAAVRAIGMVDNNFGFNPLLGMMRQRLSLGILARRSELEKLIAWYSR